MKPFIKRAAGVLVAALVAAAGTATVASADTGTLSTLSGSAIVNGDGTRNASDTGFSIAMTAGAHCSGPSSSGYLLRPYFIGSAVTLTSVDFGSTGLPFPAAGTGSGTGFVSTVTTTSGTKFQVSPGAAPAYLVSNPNQMSLYKMAGVAAVTPGVYHLGLACVDSTNHVDGNNFWDTFVTISNVTSTSFDWQFGAAPSGAAISGTAGDTQVTLNYTIPASTPAVTSATITGGPSTITLLGGQLSAGAHTGLVVPGLTNGTPYTFTLTASNGVSPAATANTTLTPTLATLNNASNVLITNLSATSATLNWSAPGANGGGQTPDTYTVHFTVPSSGAPADQSIPFGTIIAPLTGLTASTAYTVTVTAVYSEANPVDTTPSINFTTTASIVGTIIQDITVARPDGLLVMTQRCGAGTTGVLGTIHGNIPQELAGQAGLGFPNGIEQTVSNTTSLFIGGPGDNGAAPGTGGPFTTSPADPTFTTGAPLNLLSGYPYPQNADGTPHAPAYPTRCTINLGNATLLTTGPNAGQYFVATGQINQVTIVNSHESDAGWHVTGQMSSFDNTVNSAGQDRSFSGNYLGWTPVVNWQTPVSTNPLAPYAFAVTANATPAVQGTAGGLSDGDELARSLQGHSIGIAQLDARLKLIIPAQMKNGTYHGTLTFTSYNQ